jgi:uncharacterized membrane protein (DUF106 family)
MTTLNAVLGRIADAVLSPLAGLPPLVVMLALACVTALVVLGVMKVASNQARMTAAKRRIHADLLEMRLYNDDVRALLRAQGSLLRHNGAYIWLSLVPLLITALPLTLAIAQVQSWYGYTGLVPGQPTLVTADLRGPAPTVLPTLESTALDVLGPAMYFPSLQQVVWRVMPRGPGAQVVRVQPAGALAVEKTLFAGSGPARRSPSRVGPDLVTELLYPSEPPVPTDSPVAAIRVDYPERSLDVFGYEVHWLVVYLAASFAFVLALRKPLGVVI